MSDCGQELCEGWTGWGCACAVFGTEFAISGMTQQELHGPLEPPHYAPATVCVRLDGLADKIAEVLLGKGSLHGFTIDDFSDNADAVVRLLQSLAVQ
jgi:hypothetical protein